jgi:hypothetical protein
MLLNRILFAITAALALTAAVAQDEAYVRFVHALPAAGPATLVIDGTASGSSEYGRSSEAFVAIAAGTPTGAVTVDATTVPVTMGEVRASFRYIVILHPGADGAAATTVIPGWTGTLRHFPGRFVSLVPDLRRDVRLFHSSKCEDHTKTRTWWLPAQSPAFTPAYMMWEEIFVQGDVTVCHGDQRLTGNPVTPVDEYVVRLWRPRTYYLVAVPGGYELVVADETP